MGPKRGALAGAMTSLLLLSGCGVTNGLAAHAAAPAAGAVAPTLLASRNGAPAGQAASNAFGADAFINVAKKDTPGVVQITNEQVQLGAMGQGAGQAVPAGVGTGIVMDSQGHILTNDHVVRGAQKLVVSLSNGSNEYPAKLIGGDVRSDLAVIQVSGANIQPLVLGDSSKLQVGQWVIAIGNALALRGGPTVTVGVVSALNRTVQEPAPTNGSGSGAASSAGGPYLFDAIQTDAPINPGNSGGPLVDLNGDVVGINTLGAGQAEPGVQAEGIGFAIAINTAKKIAGQLIATGHVSYPFLGVATVDNTPALAAQYGLPDVPGAAVGQVTPGSPAANAGISANDVITAIGTTAITSTSDIQLALTAYKPGDQVSVTWVQAKTNKKITKTVTLAQAPAA
jgi:serine protease Do